MPDKNPSLSLEFDVGARIRTLRQERGLSLQKLSEHSGLSIGFLSQIERGLSSPSLRVLASIGDALGSGLAGLFSPATGQAQENSDVVIREGQRAQLQVWRSGISKHLLNPSNSGGLLKLFLVTMQPQASTGEELYTHEGEEAGLVLSGEMSLVVESSSWLLRPGDSFHFDSQRPHRFGNPSPDDLTTVLWVNCAMKKE